jgi:hypothetical protein
MGAFLVIMSSFVTFYPQSVAADESNGVVAGVFIPVTDLPGIATGEFATNQSDILKEGKAVYGLVNALYSKLSALSPLGIANLTKSNPSGTGPNTFTESLSFTFQWIQDLSTRTFYPVPLPTIGSNSGVGKVAIETVFPNATLVTANGAIPGEGMLFTHTMANKYGAVTPANKSNDARDWIYSIFLAAIAESTLRTSTTASAITNRTNLLTNRVTGATIPAAWYDATNPTSGILSADIPTLRIIQDALSLEYEVETNPETQTVEVKVATA